MPQPYQGPLEQLDDFRWRIPRSYKPQMNVDGIIFADHDLIHAIRQDQSPEQVANVACLPGIVTASLAMPDIHWGYGFCIGGVAATDPEQDGVISPGGVGYDINCGVRLLRTELQQHEVKPRIEKLVDRIFDNVPCGVGRGGRIKFDDKQLRQILHQGSRFVVDSGYGRPEDLHTTEAGGCLPNANPDCVSPRAIERGHDQCGTLGSGNHFLEVQIVEEILDQFAADAFGLRKGQVTLMIHSGSRGLGYQVCDDAIKDLRNVPQRYGIDLPDRQLVCAPVHSDEGQRYLGAMQSAANFAWANRQVMTYLARQSMSQVFGRPDEELGLELVYDVAHNIAKMEEHEVDGRKRTLCVHRKGATRAFPAGHPELTPAHRDVGQPVLVPGDMGRTSWVLVGTPSSMQETFGSCCHGAGRLMSRKAAIRAAKGRSIGNELRKQGIIARARGRHGLDEEQPDAYKDATQVANAVHNAGIAKKVARLRPLGVIKG